MFFSVWQGESFWGHIWAFGIGYLLSAACIAGIGSMTGLLGTPDEPGLLGTTGRDRSNDSVCLTCGHEWS